MIFDFVIDVHVDKIFFGGVGGGRVRHRTDRLKKKVITGFRPIFMLIQGIPYLLFIFPTSLYMTAIKESKVNDGCVLGSYFMKNLKKSTNLINE